MSEQVTNVEHADQVGHADHTEQAGRVQNAGSVGTVDHLDLHMDSVGSNKIRWLKLARDLMLLLLAIGSFAALIVVFLDKQDDQNRFLDQSKANAVAIAALTSEVNTLQSALDSARAELEQADQEDDAAALLTAAANNCVSLWTGQLVAALGEAVVVIATTPPGSPERADQAGAVVANLAVARDTLAAVTAAPTPNCPTPAQ